MSDPSLDKLVTDLTQDPPDTTNPALAESAPVEPINKIPNTFNSLPPVKESRNYLKLGCIALAIFLFLTFLCGICASYFYLRGHSVPYISALVEDVYASPADQLSQKMGFATDVMILNFMNESNKSDSISFQTDLTSNNFDPFVKIAEQEMAKIQSFQYSIKGKVSYNLDQPVLGVDTEAGSIGEADLEKIMASTTGTLDFATDIKVHRDTEALFEGEMEAYLSIEVPGVRAATEFKGVLDDQNAYFLLNYFPENPWIDTDTIVKRWIYFDREDSGLEELLSQSSMDSIGSYYGTSGYGVSDSMTMNAEDLEKLKRVFRTETFLNNVSSLPDREVGPNKSKCYRLDLSGDKLYQYIYEIGQIYEQENLDLEEIRSEFEGGAFETLTLDMCFAYKTNLPVYFATNFKVQVDDFGSVEMNLEYSEFALANYQVVIPPNTINYEDIDWDKVFNGLYSNLGNTYLESNNAVRRSDVDSIMAALRQHILRDLDGDPAGLNESCMITTLPILDPFDGIGATEGGPLFDLSYCLSDYIDMMPYAPGSSTYRWGVDDATSPIHVYVGVDSMDSEDGFVPADYYLVY